MKPPSEYSFPSTACLLTVYNDRTDRKIIFLGYSVNEFLKCLSFSRITTSSKSQIIKFDKDLQLLLASFELSLISSWVCEAKI